MDYSHAAGMLNCPVGTVRLRLRSHRQNEETNEVYRMNEEIDLIDKMRQLASALPREASPQVKERVAAAFRARHPRKAPVWFYAAAAVALLALGLSFIHKRQPASPPAAVVYNAPGFIALPYSQSGVPTESVVVIRVQVTPSQLSSMGVAVPAAASTARLQADVLVGQDGVARAVRLVE